MSFAKCMHSSSDSFARLVSKMYGDCDRTSNTCTNTVLFRWVVQSQPVPGAKEASSLLTMLAESPAVDVRPCIRTASEV
jgi:hypothetical protein